MKQKGLSRWLKAIIIGVGVCGLVILFAVIPQTGFDMAILYPEFSWCFWPWLIFLWMTGIPCFAVLVLGWKIASNIGKDRSFTLENAGYLKWIAWIMAVDSAFFFIVNIIYGLLGMNHPGILIMSVLVTFAGVIVTVVAAVLSHLVRKAADLQEQSDLTI